MFEDIGKKGVDISYTVLMEVILALIIVAAVLLYVNDVATDSLFEQNFLARDIALLTDSVYASPGNITFNYDSSLNSNNVLFFIPTFHYSNFSYAFQDSSVLVFRPSAGLYTDPALYPFAQDTKIALVVPEGTAESKINQNLGLTQPAKRIILQKQGDTLNISMSIIENTGQS